MKRAALALAFLSIALLAGCGAGDAGRWIVDTSLRSAYGCSLMISSDQSAETAGDVAKRPEPLLVRDRAIVAKDTKAEAAPEIAAVVQRRHEEAVEIAEVPISRDLSSIRGKGARTERAVYRYARAMDAPRFHIHVSRPEAPEGSPTTTICPTSKGYRG